MLLRVAYLISKIAIGCYFKACNHQCQSSNWNLTEGTETHECVEICRKKYVASIAQCKFNQ